MKRMILINIWVSSRFQGHILSEEKNFIEPGGRGAIVMKWEDMTFAASDAMNEAELKGSWYGLVSKKSIYPWKWTSYYLESSREHDNKPLSSNINIWEPLKRWQILSISIICMDIPLTDKHVQTSMKDKENRVPHSFHRPEFQFKYWIFQNTFLHQSWQLLYPQPNFCTWLTVKTISSKNWKFSWFEIVMKILGRAKFQILYGCF